MLVRSSLLSKISLWLKVPVSSGLIVFLAGGLLPLAFSPLDLYPLAVLSPMVLFYSFLNTTPRAAAWSGYWYGLGFFGVGVSWVFVAIHDFSDTPLILAVLLTFIFVSVLSACIALQGYLSAWFITKLRKLNPGYSVIVVFPFFWVLIEWFRGWFLTGFPWLNLGNSQTDSVLAGYAPVIGVYGVSWLLVLSSGSLLAAFLVQQKRTWFMLGFIFIWFGGAMLSQLNWTEKTGKPLKVSLVQGNVEQIDKWDPVQFEKRKARYLSLTRKHWDSDLVLWPENSLTLFYHQLKNNFLKQLSKEAHQHKTEIVLGLPVLHHDTGEYFSSLMTIGSKTEFYNKSHLVPFGEFVPLASLLRGVIAFFDLPMSGFTAGDMNQKALTVAGQQVAPTICYEDAFGEELRRFLPEATLIVNASNNAWYGDSFAPHQHLQISRIRALETGRDVMRVTTNGISALINYKGSILARSPQFKAYVVTGYVQARTGATPYVEWGNYPVLLLIFTGLGVTFLIFRNKAT